MITRNQRGLTLIELVTALAILAVLATAVTFRISTSTNAARLRAAAEWTASVIRQAVRLSWTQQTPVRVQFQVGSTGPMTVVVTVWNGSTWVPAPGFSLPSLHQPTGTAISGTTYPSHTLTITPFSRGVLGIEASVQVTEGAVTLSAGGASMQVSTTRHGEVRVSP